MHACKSTPAPTGPRSRGSLAGTRAVRRCGLPLALAALLAAACSGGAGGASGGGEGGAAGSGGGGCAPKRCTKDACTWTVPGCDGTAVCGEPPALDVCGNGLDDDCDGKADCADADCAGDHAVIDEGVPLDAAAVRQLEDGGFLVLAEQGGALSLLRTDAAGDPVGRVLPFGGGTAPQLARNGPGTFVAGLRDGLGRFRAYVVPDDASRYTPVDIPAEEILGNGGVQPAGDDGALVVMFGAGKVTYAWVGADGKLRGSWRHESVQGLIAAAGIPRTGGVALLSLDAELTLRLLRLEGPDSDTVGLPVFDAPVKRFRVERTADGGAAVAAVLDVEGATHLGIARVDAAGRLAGAVDLGAADPSVRVPGLFTGGGHVVVTAPTAAGTWSYWDVPAPPAAVAPAVVPVKGNVHFLELDPPGVNVMVGRQAFPVLVYRRTRHCP